MKNPFTVEQWIGWMVATATAALTMSAYAFNKLEMYETVEHARFTRQEMRDEMLSRFDRIENKLDRLTEMERRR